MHKDTLLFYVSKSGYVRIPSACNMDLSILIPNYNRNVTDLVASIVPQARTVLNAFEILIADDGSDKKTRATYKSLKAFNEVHVILHERNIGRAATRNNLIARATYPWILCIDSDALILNDQFLKIYSEYLDHADVIVGGIQYQELRPSRNEFMLRWTYGRAREQRTACQRNRNPWAAFSAFNFMARRSVFETVRFPQEFNEYGHEDTLFGLAMRHQKFHILHIDNPLVHMGLENSSEFLEKTNKGLKNLMILEQYFGREVPLDQYITLIRYVSALNRWHMMGFITALFQLFERPLMRNLQGRNPYVWCFQFYKLTHYYKLKKRSDQV